MPSFEYTSRMPFSAGAVFAWHETPGSFGRLQPPWVGVKVLHADAGVENGGTVSLRVRRGPVFFRWDLVHCGYVPGRRFEDVQIRGPFRRWRHTHRVEARGPRECELTDHIEYELPLGVTCRVIERLMNNELHRLFTYRHDVTREAVAALETGVPWNSVNRRPSGRRAGRAPYASGR